MCVLGFLWRKRFVLIDLMNNFTFSQYFFKINVCIYIQSAQFQGGSDMTSMHILLDTQSKLVCKSTRVQIYLEILYSNFLFIHHEAKVGI